MNSAYCCGSLQTREAGKMAKSKAWVESTGGVEGQGVTEVFELVIH